MFAFLGRLCVVHPRKVCAVWAVVGLLLALVAPSWDPHRGNDDSLYLPDRCDSLRGQQLLRQSFPDLARGSQLVLAVASLQPQEPVDLAFADRLRDELEAQTVGTVAPSVDAVDDKLALIRIGLASSPRTAATRVEIDRVERVARGLTATSASVPRLSLAGSAALGRDLDRSALWANITVVTMLIGLLAVVLLLVTRAPLLALAGTAAAAAATGLALKVMALPTWDAGVSVLDGSRSWTGVLLFSLTGLTTLLFVRRLKEELATGRDLPLALIRAVNQIAPRLLIGTAVLGVGWLLLAFTEYGRLRSTGLCMVLALPMLVAAFLTLLPAVIRWMGPIVLWEAWKQPSRLPVSLPVWAVRFREPWARLVSRHPAWIGGTLLVLAAPLMLFGLQVQATKRPGSEASPATVHGRGLACLSRHNVAGEAAPLQVLLISHTSWALPQAEEFLTQTTNSLAHVPQVARVRTANEPSFRTTLKSLSGAPAPRAAHIARLEVVLKAPAGSEVSTDGVEVVQAWLRERLPAAAAGLGHITWEVAGPPATARDLSRVVAADGTRAAWITLAVLLTILAVLVGRIEALVHLILAVAVSYPAALGFAGLAGPLWGGGPLGEIDLPTAALLFPILIAAGASLSLLPAQRGPVERSGLNAEAVLQRGLVWRARRTAGYALLWAGFWTVLVAAGRGEAARLGLAVAFGLLMDAVVVRRFLAPAVVGYLLKQRRDLLTGWQRLTLPQPVRRAG